MIEIKNLHKAFGDNKVLQGVNLDIDTGETLVIIGRSGCGKSVLIKHIVGLLYPDDGYVKVEGRKVDEMSMKELYELRTKFGFLFQGSALFDSMTVEENISLPLVESRIKISISEIDKKVAEKLEMVGMSGVQKLKPAELSGGMKKRVGLARALITDPDYIFYDEPTTGLDPITTKVIHTLMADMQRQLNITSIVISHDIDIFTVADYVALLHNGKIEYFGDAKTIWETTNPYIYQFIRGLPDGPIQTELAIED